MRYTLEDILAKMPGSHKQHGDEWETGCPVCGSDHHLYFKDNGGQILANCQHCGATLPKVLEAAGMKGGNGFTAGRHTGRFDFNATNQHQGQAKPKKAAKPKDHGRIIENTHRAHIYRNPDGTEAYWKDRKKYEDGHKEFYFFHSGADGEEVKGKPENCNNLYHLDELEQARTRYAPVYR
jgi:putative DNA primase/helicase